MKHRLQQLKTGSSEKLFVIGKIDSGDLELEKQLHKNFRCKNLEWYFADSDLLEYINSHNYMNMTVDLLGNKVMVYQKMQYITGH